MGVDCQLLVNAKWNVRHIKQLLIGLNYKIEKVDLNEDHSFLTIDNGSEFKTWLYVARSCNYGGVDGLLLSCRANDPNLKLLKRVSEVLGGFLCESDSDSNWEMVQEPHNGNVRFILDHTILRDAISKSNEIGDAVSDAIGYERNRK